MNLIRGRGRDGTTVMRGASGHVPRSHHEQYQYIQTTMESRELPCDIASQSHDILYVSTKYKQTKNQKALKA